MQNGSESPRIAPGTNPIYPGPTPGFFHRSHWGNQGQGPVFLASAQDHEHIHNPGPLFMGQGEETPSGPSGGKKEKDNNRDAPEKKPRKLPRWMQYLIRSSKREKDKKENPP